MLRLFLRAIIVVVAVEVVGPKIIMTDLIIHV
jgi:hypothetical protein